MKPNGTPMLVTSRLECLIPNHTTSLENQATSKEIVQSFPKKGLQGFPSHSPLFCLKAKIGGERNM